MSKENKQERCRFWCKNCGDINGANTTFDQRCAICGLPAEIRGDNAPELPKPLTVAKFTAVENTTKTPDSAEVKAQLKEALRQYGHNNTLVYDRDEVHKVVSKLEAEVASHKEYTAEIERQEDKIDELLAEVERLKATCHALRQSATAVTNYDGKVATWPEIASLIRDERDACGLSA